MPDKVLIFDTTLRDGEQSPGASMNQEEKLSIARLLEEFEHMVGNMSQAFPINPMIKNLYNDLSELLFEALAELSGGDYCD